MFEDYKKSLRDFYLIKKKNRRLSVNWNPPGREKLRRECLKVLRRKNTTKDRDFIKSVFDPENEYENLTRSIERFNLDKFRPLVSFLTEEGRNIRDDKHIKLLFFLLVAL